MKIEPKSITVRELTEDYEDNGDSGVLGYGGKLDIRPPYQREFVYKDHQRDAVLDTASKKFPLNVMYWAVREDGGFEVIDGQQRTISLAQYVTGVFSMSIFGNEQPRFFYNLQDDEKKRLLDYELTVYLCSGTDSEKLDWFKTINIAGEKLTEQELRNAVYHGPWVASAKPYFSKANAPGPQLADGLLSGIANRQEILETAIEWITHGSTAKDPVADYMAAHQKDTNATPLWLHFQAVVAWVRATFPKYRKEMKGLPWGDLYAEFKDVPQDATELEAEVSRLMADEDVTNKRGIYDFVLSRREKSLNIRGFSPNQRREAYERQGGLCVQCGQPFALEDMDADHITPWIEGGKTEAANCQLLCKTDNRTKGAR